jgi:hypothetical protein
VCNLLKHAGNFLPPDFLMDVVFMAPAVTTELFAQTVQQFGSRIREIRMFTMKDELEKKDQLIPVVYPHSLLYFISGVLEDESDKPVLGMHRYFTGGASFYSDPLSGIPAAKSFLSAGRDRVALSVTTGVAGMETDSVSHGGFDDSEAGKPRKTIDSVNHILKNGF